MYRPAIILLVEDDPGDQKLIKKSLCNQKVGNDIKIADCAENALEYLEKSKAGDNDFPMPDLILLDLNMPGMGGKEFLKEVKSDSALSIIPVVILTTSDSDKDILESFKLQASGYVKKPVTLVEFQKVLSDLTDYWFVICKHVDQDSVQPNGQNLCTTN